MSKEKLNRAFAARKAKEDKKSEEKPKKEINLQPFVDRFTQEKLDEYKAQYGGRPLIYIAVGDYRAILRPPTADDLGDYMTAIGTNGMSKAVAMIIEQLWIDGDFELIDDEDMFISVFLQMNNILETKKAEFFRA
jgi:hypothetical protein|nr:MAG TPA: hypothetical protein [Caudoviricetes sp.]DAY26231.1 MAG TPA: hypothetical protein [Caudoviricetes sp.]